MRSSLVAAMMLSTAQAQRGSPFRCRNRDAQCFLWKENGECERNHEFMMEQCAPMCKGCENIGLAATPAKFELDYVCGDKLAVTPDHQTITVTSCRRAADSSAATTARCAQCTSTHATAN